MKRKRFTEDQIIAVLREHEAGAKAGDLARRHGVSEATLYNWKAKYGGMDVSDAKRLNNEATQNPHRNALWTPLALTFTSIPLHRRLLSIAAELSQYEYEPCWECVSGGGIGKTAEDCRDRKRRSQTQQ